MPLYPFPTPTPLCLNLLFVCFVGEFFGVFCFVFSFYFCFCFCFCCFDFVGSFCLCFCLCFYFKASRPGVGVVYRTLPSIFVGKDLEVFPEHGPPWMHSSDSEGLCWATLLEEQSRLQHMDHHCLLKLLL